MPEAYFIKHKDVNGLQQTTLQIHQLSSKTVFEEVPWTARPGINSASKSLPYSRLEASSVLIYHLYFRNVCFLSQSCHHLGILTPRASHPRFLEPVKLFLINENNFIFGSMRFRLFFLKYLTVMVFHFHNFLPYYKSKHVH